METTVKAAEYQQTPRYQELVQSVEQIKKIHDRWEDEGSKPAPPESFFNACEVAIQLWLGTESGDIPGKLKQSYDAMLQLARSYSRHVHRGDHGPSGELLSHFRQSLRTLFHAHRPTTALPRPAREQQQSAKQMLAGFGADPRARMWTARAFGYFDEALDRYIGPLFTDSGMLDHGAIDKELEKEWSVIGERWEHPDSLRAVRKSEEARELLAGMMRDEDLIEEAQDEGTIEELLRQGQFGSVIERVLNVTTEEVKAVADEMGIEVPVKPNWADITEADPSKGEVEPPKLNTAQMRDLVEPYKGSDRGAAEIASQIRSDNRLSAAQGVTAKAVADLLREE